VTWIGGHMYALTAGVSAGARLKGRYRIGSGGRGEFAPGPLASAKLPAFHRMRIAAVMMCMLDLWRRTSGKTSQSRGLSTNA
jgi:hypothetical protein